MPNQKGSIAIIIGVIVILAALTAAYYFGQKNSLNLKPNSSPPVPVVETKAVDKQEIMDWQKFNLKFGQINIYYPPKWVVRAMPPYSVWDYHYIDFFPVDHSVVTSDHIISLNVQRKLSFPNPNYIPTPTPQDNFVIPSLGDKPNAYYNQQDNSTIIIFTRNGVEYVLSLDLNQGLRANLDPANLTDIFNKMAKTIEFTDQAGSCDDPVLKPLSDFPSDFILLNHHKSDGSDPVKYYYPDMISPTNSSPNIKSSFPTNDDLIRYFALIYQKDGGTFDDTTAFQKTVVPINGTREVWLTDKTAIIGVNCSIKPGPNALSGDFVASQDGSDLFAIDLYGKSDNPQKLWGVANWNINTLKGARDTVYIKRANKWQAYKAINYSIGL